MNITQQINEVFANAGVKLLEEDYKEDFLKELTQISSFKDKIAFANDRLKKLGAGSSRVVFELSPTSVLKIAKNNKGIAQNDAEIRGALDAYPDVFAQVLDADYQNSLWIEMEKAEPLTAQAVKEEFDLSLQQFFKIIEAICTMLLKAQTGKKGNEFEQEVFDKYLANEHYLFYNFYIYFADFSPTNYADFLRKANWGVVNRNGQKRCVIVDSGLNDDVAQQYYNWGR